jgi:hypothetical protein
MSKGIEKLLKRMVAPDAVLRCSAADAMVDAYWGGRMEPVGHSMYFIFPVRALIANVFFSSTARTLS